MERVMVIGPCGAGKSTLAFALADRTGLPLFHMDKLAWKPGWVDRGNDELREILRSIVIRERWLIEGSYGSTLPDRLPYADSVVYLDFPIWLCLARILRRIWHYRGRTRPDMTEGCPERLDIGFLWYVVRWNAGPRKRLEPALAAHVDKVVRLRNPREAHAWLEGAPRH
jgi:adenylate kinase family enzyme